jgi:hypothetical protein
MEGIDRRIDEAIPALKVELKCSPCFVFTCTIRNASYRAADCRFFDALGVNQSLP